VGEILAVKVVERFKRSDSVRTSVDLLLRRVTIVDVVTRKNVTRLVEVEGRTKAGTDGALFSTTSGAGLVVVGWAVRRRGGGVVVLGVGHE
jgi:hypothetical protein